MVQRSGWRLGINAKPYLTPNSRQDLIALLIFIQKSFGTPSVIATRLQFHCTYDIFFVDDTKKVRQVEKI